MVVTLSQIAAEVLDSIDCTSSGWPDTTNLYRKANRSLSELYDLLVTHHEQYFIERCTITTSTSYDYIVVPDGWYPVGSPECYKVLKLFYPYNGKYNEIFSMTATEYPSLASNTESVYEGQDLRWIQLGNKIVFNGTPASAYDLTLWYAPQLYELSTLLLASGEAFDSSNWTKLDTARDVVVAHALANPINGKRNADSIAGFTTSTTHGVTQAVTLTSARYNFSVYLKSDAKTFAYLSSSVGSVSCYFNLTTGAVGTAANCVGQIQSMGNGWYRCSIDFPGTAASHTLSIQPAASGSSTTYAGDGSTVDLYMFGAQLIQDTKPAVYQSITDKVDWDIPFNWTSYVIYDVAAQLMAREESDYNYWMSKKMEVKSNIVGAAMTRNIGESGRLTRTYRRR